MMMRADQAPNPDVGSVDPSNSAKHRKQVRDLSSIYARSAGLKLAERNPIIFIPGILGSKLIDPETSEGLWGDFASKLGDPRLRQVRELLALPMREGARLDNLISSARDDGTVDKVGAKRLPFRIGAYGTIMQNVGIGKGLGASEGESDNALENAFGSFEFGYDWRRSLDETAGRLDDFLNLATHFVQSARGNGDPVKFDVIAHSMGGLILRYYLRHGRQLLANDGSLPRLSWAGCEKVARAIVIGTPNAGSANSLRAIVEGLKGKTLIHSAYDAAIVGTMPSIYQLMPRVRHNPLLISGQPVDYFDSALWRRMGWGLADPNLDNLLAIQLPELETQSDRYRVASDHLDKCLRQANTFHRAMDREATPPEGFELHAVVGDNHPTLEVLGSDYSTKTLRDVKFGSGDGTVLRTSVLLDERPAVGWSPKLISPIKWKSIVFAAANHMGLTSDRVTLDNVLFNILERPVASADS